MSGTFDQEDLWLALLSVMNTNSALNNKISAIDTEKTTKGQPLTPALATIDDDGFFLQTWTDKILNKAVAIFYGTEGIQTTPGGLRTAKVYTMFVEVIYCDNGQYPDSSKRISRYARALEELFNQTDSTQFGIPKGYFIVEQIVPFNFKKDLDSNEDYKVGGITIKITMV
jgi:hypothetical protein